MSNKKVGRGPKKTQVEDMTEYEIARWSALMLGIEKISDMAEAKHLDFNTTRIDQPALDRFVDEISDDVLFSMQQRNILEDLAERNPSVIGF